jgi:hypothetical protein
MLSMQDVYLCGSVTSIIAIKSLLFVFLFTLALMNACYQTPFNGRSCEDTWKYDYYGRGRVFTDWTVNAEMEPLATENCQNGPSSLYTGLPARPCR